MASPSKRPKLDTIKDISEIDLASTQASVWGVVIDMSPLNLAGRTQI